MAPNVVIILLDDAGFGQTSTFGGLIPTPSVADPFPFMQDWIIAPP